MRVQSSLQLSSIFKHQRDNSKPYKFHADGVTEPPESPLPKEGKPVQIEDLSAEHARKYTVQNRDQKSPEIVNPFLRRSTTLKENSTGKHSFLEDKRNTSGEEDNENSFLWDDNPEQKNNNKLQAAIKDTLVNDLYHKLSLKLET